MICVSGLLPPERNNNLVIEKYIVDGMAAVVGLPNVMHVPSRLAQHNSNGLKIDLILAIGSVADQSSRLLDLRRLADRCSCPLALWLVDDPYEFDFRDQAISVADHIFTVEIGCLEYYDVEHVSHLMLAGSRDDHYEPLVEPRHIDFDFSFCGVGFKNRRYIVDSIGGDHRFEKFKLAVFGAHWNENRFTCNRRLAPDETRNLTRRSRFVLNMGRDYSIANRNFELMASSPGPRTFEVALQGVPQAYALFGYEIGEVFALEQEIIPFDGPRDLLMILERSYDQPDWLPGVARKAQARALSDHTYEARARHIIDFFCLNHLAPSPP